MIRSCRAELDRKGVVYRSGSRRHVFKHYRILVVSRDRALEGNVGPIAVQRGIAIDNGVDEKMSMAGSV